MSIARYEEKHVGNDTLLHTLDLPNGIRDLDEKLLISLSAQVSELILDVGSQNGGHLASSLGAVELAVALLHVFDVERDRIIWNVGHQSHGYEILRGRRGRYDTTRKKLGLSGYPKRSESSYDCFGTDHSSTSISVALGMAVARDIHAQDHHVIAVIGDGAIGAGMALEGLSNAGYLKKNLLVVLNDNEMSISKSVGAMSSYLNRLITSGLYNRARGDLKSFMTSMGERVMDVARRLEHGVKGIVIPGGIFEDLGFRYVGPVDGNDVSTLVHCLQNIKRLDGPILLHCVTQKGKGYPYAEADPLKWHGVNQYEIAAGELLDAKPTGNRKNVPTFTEAFADCLTDLAAKDERIVGITAAMPTGTGLSKFEKQFPDRFFDVGICEQHAVTFAAGLAAEGMKPVAAIYSTFLQRGFDQYIHDVCLQNLPVIFAIDRAGLVGEDSPIQQGAFDLSYLRCIPNVKILVPRDAIDLGLSLEWALTQNGPVALRYARSTAPAIGDPENRDVTRGEVLCEGDDAYFLAVGPCAAACLDAVELLHHQGFSVGVADARYVKPLDTELLEEICHLPLITVEENTLEGGFGSAVLEYFESLGRIKDVRIKRCGIPDRFIDHASRSEQLEECGLDAEGLASVARKLLDQAGRSRSSREPVTTMNQ